MKMINTKFDELPNIEKCDELLDLIPKKVKPSLTELTNNTDKPLILYGAGELGKMAKKYFDKLNVPFLFVVDKKASLYKDNLFWKDNVVIEPYNVPLYFRKSCLTVICIVTSSFTEIRDSLNALGFENVIPFYDITLSHQDKHPLKNGWITSLLDNTDIKNMKFITSNLKDDISRAHYLQFIAWHSCREEWVFKDAPISLKEKYFIPEITSVLHENEIFVNVGAYDGEFTTKFMKVVNNKFSAIYAFEPDKKNINKFLTNLKESMDNYNIILIPKALGKTAEKKKFYSGIDCLSQLNELGQEEIAVHRLNDFNLNPTIVKIHIEGLESDVIDGGMETILQERPILMVTIYHNRKASTEIPLKLMYSLDNYNFYFRLHLWCGTSGIIYAIPKERLKESY